MDQNKLCDTDTISIRYFQISVMLKAWSHDVWSSLHQLQAPSSPNLSRQPLVFIALTFLILSTKHFPNNSLTQLFRDALLRNF